MFGLDSGEFLVIAIVAIVVIGPKDLPRALYKVGQVMGKARAMSRHFRSGIDAMVREVELEELEKKWAEDNRRIMAEHPMESLDAPSPASSAAVEEADSALAAMEDGATRLPPAVPAQPPKDDPA